MRNLFFKKNSGYTIIETMIAISIFSVIATAGTAALLNASVVHQKSQDMRSLIDSLSFIMEEVSRNVRTGYGYRCMATFSASSIEVPQSCASGRVIAFESAPGDDTSTADQWVYKIEGSGSTYTISRSVDSGITWVQLNPAEVVLSSASGFSVLGAEAQPGNTQQPLVTIKLVGSITYKNVTSPFSIETAVSQRLIDIP